MTPILYRCLPSHPENVRWQQDCGNVWPGMPGGAICPKCGAYYVEQVKSAKS